MAAVMWAQRNNPSDADYQRLAGVFASHARVPVPAQCLCGCACLWSAVGLDRLDADTLIRVIVSQVCCVWVR